VGRLHPATLQESTRIRRYESRRTRADGRSNEPLEPRDARRAPSFPPPPPPPPPSLQINARAGPRFPFLSGIELDIRVSFEARRLSLRLSRPPYSRRKWRHRADEIFLASLERIERIRARRPITRRRTSILTITALYRAILAILAILPNYRMTRDIE